MISCPVWNPNTFCVAYISTYRSSPSETIRRDFRFTIDCGLWQSERQFSMMSSHKHRRITFSHPSAHSHSGDTDLRFPHTSWITGRKKKHLKISFSTFAVVFFGWDNLRAFFAPSVGEALTKCKSNFRRMWTHQAKNISSIYHSFCVFEIFLVFSSLQTRFFGMNKIMTRVEGANGWRK